MQLSVETVVWVALALVVVAVVGLFLMNSAITASQQTSQMYYVRLINSEYSPQYGGYIVTLRVVNTGEGGKRLTTLTFYPTGFPSGASIDTDLNGASGPTSITVNLDPRESRDITRGILSDYASGSKALVVEADFSGGPYNVRISVDIP